MYHVKNELIIRCLCNSTQQLAHVLSLFVPFLGQGSCCGVDSYLDFNGSNTWNSTNLDTPIACCIDLPADENDLDCAQIPLATNTSNFETVCNG